MFVCSAGPMILKLSLHQNHPGGLLKHSLLSPISQISDRAGLGWGFQNLHFSQVPGDANTEDPQTTLREPLTLIVSTMASESRSALFMADSHQLSQEQSGYSGCGMDLRSE